MRQDEHNIQVACINWFRHQYPKAVIFAIPNGGARNVVVASKLKAEGVLSGVPDLCVPMARNGFNALYIEMKAGRNKPTDNQLTIMDKLRNEGNKCVVCYSVDEFMLQVNSYLK